MKKRTKHQLNRAEAVQSVATAVGKASVLKGQAESLAATCRGKIVELVRTWTEGTPKNLEAESLNSIIVEDFEELKTKTELAARDEVKRLKELGEPVSKKPSDAARDASRGVRQRRRPLENFQEFMAFNRKAAVDSLKAGTVGGVKELTWKQRCDLWATPKTDRCREKTFMINVGTDEYGCVHSLGHDYKTKYVVEERDGKEYCTVSFGPKGDLTSAEVEVSQKRKGEVFADMEEVIEKSTRLLRNARKFVTTCLNEETPDVHRIPESRVRADS